MSCDERGAALLCGSVIACTSHGSVGAPAAHCTASAARINRGAGRSPAHIGVIQRAANGFEGAYASPLSHGKRLSAQKSPLARIHQGASRALLTSALSSAQPTASRAHTLLRYFMASDSARIKARPHLSWERAAPCSHRRYPARSQRLRGRIRFSVISWQAHSPHARRPLPRPLQRPTSPYLSGSVISCTAPSSFSSIHPPRTASGGVALRQLRRAVIS